MALLSEEARRDIVHQFDLPERRSKITSLLRQNEQLYCICRSSDSTRFMIACDHCEDWFHGDCINITEFSAKSIKRYYCPICVEANTHLKIVYTKRKGLKDKSSKSPNKVDGTAKSDRQETKKTPIKGVRKDSKHCTCAGCSLTKDCGSCINCVQNPKGGKGKRKACLRRVCHNDKPAPVAPRVNRLSSSSEVSLPQTDSGHDSEIWKPAPVVVTKKRAYTKRGEGGKAKAKKPRKPATKAVVPAKPKRAYNRKPKPEPDQDNKQVVQPRVPSPKVKDGPAQCLGVKCTKGARSDSRYCSDACGIGLAHARIYGVLPARLQAWLMTPCIAQEQNNKDLEEAHQKYRLAMEESKKLLEEREALEKHIAYVQTLETCPDTCVEEHEEEGTIYCVTCGIEIAAKTCLKHMEKCFNKSESQTTFGSTQKTMMEGPQLFCDSFHPATGLYCKRLKVLCVEHSKEAKIGEKEICGHPLVENIYDVGDKFCRIKKKKCNKHFCWEKLRRAGIDLERIRQYLKMDEMLEKEANIKNALAGRASVMGLMLNNTFDHGHEEQLKKDDEQARAKFEAEARRKAEEEQRQAAVKAAVIPDDEPEEEMRKRVERDTESSKKIVEELKKSGAIRPEQYEHDLSEKAALEKNRKKMRDYMESLKKMQEEDASQKKKRTPQRRPSAAAAGDKPKQVRKRAGKTKPEPPVADEKVFLPSKRSKDSKVKNTEPSGSGVPQTPTASQLYKKMKSSHPNTNN